MVTNASVECSRTILDSDTNCFNNFTFMKTNKIEDWEKEFADTFGNNKDYWEIFDFVKAFLTSEVKRAYDSGMSKGYIKGRTDLQPFFKEERERLLKEVGKKVIGANEKEPELDYDCVGIEERARNRLRKEQRKALSVIKEGGK